MYIFPKRHDGKDVLKYIYPSKQKTVQKIIDLASQDERIQSVIVFGSAITPKCRVGSDVDIAINAPTVEADNFPSEIASIFFRNIASEIDVVHYNTIHSTLLKDNIDKGVCVYVK